MKGGISIEKYLALAFQKQTKKFNISDLMQKWLNMQYTCLIARLTSNLLIKSIFIKCSRRTSISVCFVVLIFFRN